MIEPKIDQPFIGWPEGAIAHRFLLPNEVEVCIVRHASLRTFTVETVENGQPSGVVLARGEQDLLCSSRVSLRPIYPYDIVLDHGKILIPQPGHYELS